MADSNLFGGIGGAVGGMAGAAMNFVEYQQQREDERRREDARRKALAEAGAKADTTFQSMQDILEEAQKGQYEWATPEQKELYQQMVNEYAPQTYEFGKFSDEYNKTAEDFLNPEAEKIAELAGLRKQGELAGMGAGRGTGADALIGYSKWQAAEDLWKDAQEQAYRDRSQAYQEYGDYIDRQQKKLDTINQGNLQKISLLQGNIAASEQQKSDNLSDLLAIMGDKSSGQINLGVAGASA
jgi:hypothetical protein